MLRSRVRRSFTVEVKSKSRQTPSWPETATPSPVNWAALDPAPETPSPFEESWSGTPAAAASAVPAEKPRRILPNLIVAEAEPEAPEPATVREERLPRVRRVKLPKARSEAPTGNSMWSFADIDDDDAPVPVIRPAPPQRQVATPAAQPVSVSPVAATVRKPTRPWTSEPALGPGERWKRRLPRSCR